MLFPLVLAAVVNAGWAYALGYQYGATMAALRPRPAVAALPAGLWILALALGAAALGADLAQLIEPRGDP